MEWEEGASGQTGQLPGILEDRIRRGDVAILQEQRDGVDVDVAFEGAVLVEGLELLGGDARRLRCSVLQRDLACPPNLHPRLTSAYASTGGANSVSMP